MTEANSNPTFSCYRGVEYSVFRSGDRFIVSCNDGPMFSYNESSKAMAIITAQAAIDLWHGRR